MNSDLNPEFLEREVADPIRKIEPGEEKTLVGGAYGDVHVERLQ